MRRLAGVALVAVVVCCAPGCGTFHNLDTAATASFLAKSPLPPQRSCYGGVRRDLLFGCQFLTEGMVTYRKDQDRLAGAVVGLYVLAIDVPFSAIGDTILLPYTFLNDLGQAIAEGDQDPRPKDDRHYELPPSLTPSTLMEPTAK